MFAKFFETLADRFIVDQTPFRDGRLSARPEFRRKIEEADPGRGAAFAGGTVVFLTGQVSLVLDDVARLREAGYDVHVGMDAARSGVVFVVDPDTFATQDALGRMLALIRDSTVGARVIIRTTAANEDACRRIVGGHGVLLAPDETMEDIADLLGGDVIHSTLRREASADATFRSRRVAS